MEDKVKEIAHSELASSELRSEPALLLSNFSGIEGIMSPLTVVPLHRLFGDVRLVGLSQLDQSLSSIESAGRGVHENRLVGLVASVLDLRRGWIGLELLAASISLLAPASGPVAGGSSNADVARGRAD